MCAEFNIYHLMNLAPGEEIAFKEGSDKTKAIDQAKVNGLFRWRVQSFGNGDRQDTNETRIHANTAQTVEHVDDTNRKISEREGLQPTAPRIAPAGTLILGDVASILRSKNAGPFEITFDVMFDTEEIYRAVKDSGALDQPLVETLYNLDPDEVIWCGWFDQARAFKATIPRKRKSQLKAAGGFGETDVHGSQQYVPLFRNTFPEDVSENLRKLIGF